MIRTLILLGISYAGVCGAVYALQDSLLFFPRANYPGAVARLTGYAWATHRGAIHLTGWFIPADEPESAPLVLYYGGNAQDVAFTAATRRHAANTLYVNYRGYGSSGGKPSEAALLADALHVFDEATATLPHDGRVVLHGRSLGSAVAVYVAAKRRADGIVLVTPFDSVLSLARARYWFLPVTPLLRHHFDSASRAAAIDTPVLVLIAGRDRVVPAQHAQALIKQWQGPVETLRLETANHLTVTDDPTTLAHINRFILSAGQSAPRGSN